jgi:hydrogenase expression/formation protein HypC
MCLILPSRVVAVNADEIEVELTDGQRALVSAALTPDLAIGDYVLVDRGLVVETIDAEEAAAILNMYREIGELLEAEDALT